jgi:hypothetical protein
MRLTTALLGNVLVASSILWSATPVEAACIDIHSREPVGLNGILRYLVFPGPPNFEDIRKGDAPERAYILALSDPICIESDEFGDPVETIATVHLIPSGSIGDSMRSLINSRVFIRVTELMIANTAHHHAPLVADVIQISKGR